MTPSTIEDRLAALEEKVAELWSKAKSSESPNRPWWEQIAGTFADDPMYEEAMRLGRAWRETLQQNSSD